MRLLTLRLCQPTSTPNTVPNPAVIDPLVAARIKAVILDVDGVLTDGGLYYTDAGETMKRFHVHDGHGIKRIREQGLRVWVISGRSGAMLDRRLAELGIDASRSGSSDKLKSAQELMAGAQIQWSEVAVMGDDEPDLPLLQRAAVSGVPANAHPCVLTTAQWRSQFAGGAGAVREFCDALMSARRSL